jgi:hypothetical protein
MDFKIVSLPWREGDRGRGKPLIKNIAQELKSNHLDREAGS